MTEYGRGQGSEPWHPEDPSYGNDGWGGQQAHVGPQSPYGGQPQHYPEQPQQQHYGDWGNGEQSAYGQQHYQGYDQQYDQQYYAGQGQQPYDQGQQAYDQGSWGTGTHTHVQYTDPHDPYAQQAAASYGGDQHDYYGTPDAYPPPEPPHRRQTEPEPPQTDWDPGPDQGEHAFFADEDGDDADDDAPKGRRGRGDSKGTNGGKKKRRNGCACLVVVLVFGGGLGGAGYLGYHYYKNRFAAAPDYAGNGTSQMVTVVIPKGALGSVIGQRLKEAGVVKSVDAFVTAQQQNADGNKIQAGAYILRKRMSGASAVAMMLDTKSQANVMVTPGQRNAGVYAAIDAKLGLAPGTTRTIAKTEYKTLGLPSWANSDSKIKDPLEGFLYPATYPAAKGMKPETILKDMVSQASRNYAKYDLVAKAKALKLDSPLQLVTVASLVQAEGKTSDDYRKMAEVVYNRLNRANPETYGFLQFDSTFNYLKSASNIRISEGEINRNKDPYNTYTNKGLPPGPIGNPGTVALQATLNPTHEGWYYFVATDGVSKTEFAKTHQEFQKLKDKFNATSGN
ncbi:endolytic transglycosylase MltG [Streptomyces sp. NPDC001351]|uniref:endolytic transglycosylase MltG n=1 Tax=Streptomyces sp. NPDC001351 TaxID=3364564 RepID=UPI00369A5C48